MHDSSSSDIILLIIMSDLFLPTTMESVQRAAPDPVSRLLRWSGEWASGWRWLGTTEHHHYTFSVHPHTRPVRQVLSCPRPIVGGIKALEGNHFPQFVQLINGRAWIPVTKALSLMIFYLPSRWFSTLKSPRFIWWLIGRTLASCSLKNYCHLWSQKVITRVQLVL